MTNHIPLEALALVPMASGHLSLELSDGVSWERFESYAEALLTRLGGTIISRADSPVERVWTVEVHGQRYWLSHDPYSPAVSLDSQDAAGSAGLRKIAAELGYTG